VLRLLGDLVDDVLVIELRLAAEPGIRFHVVGAIEIVRFAVLHLGERFEALLHPDVAGGAGADSAARRTVLCTELLRGVQQRGPRSPHGWRCEPRPAQPSAPPPSALRCADAPARRAGLRSSPAASRWPSGSAAPRPGCRSAGGLARLPPHARWRRAACARSLHR